MPLTLSPHLDLVVKPAIDLPNAVVLTPDSYTSWATMFEANKSKTQYLLTPGDYISWGKCVRNNVAGGTVSKPKLIAYYHPDDDDQHPVDRVGGNEALCADFRFTGKTTTNWMVHGITTRGETSNWLMDGGCSGITFDYCLIEDKKRSENAYMMRIRHATNCTVQRCVIRNFILPDPTPDKPTPGDSTGIAIGNSPQDVTGIRILDCEVYNVGDCIQLTDGPTPWKPVEVVIEGCDLYMTTDYHIFNGTTDTQTTWLENGIDIKAGSHNQGKLRVHDNRIWGFRHNAKPSALGEGIVIQRLARNIKISNNIIGDCPIGMKDGNWPISGTLGTKAVMFASDHILTTTEKHRFLTGQGPMMLTTTDALPTGLSTTVEYYVIVHGPTTFRLAETYGDAIAETPVVEFSNNGTGKHKIHFEASELGPKLVMYDHTTGIFTTTSAHHFLTGQGLMELRTSGELPEGLSADVGYYVIVLSPTTFHLAATYDNAIAKIPIEKPSDNGTGRHTIRIKVGQTRNITVTNNQFYAIRDYATLELGDYATSDAGAVWVPITDISYTNNHIARSTYLCSRKPTRYYGPVFTGNTLSEVASIQRPTQSPELNYHADQNMIDTHTGLYDTYERKRWTGIEVVHGAIRLDP